MLAADFDRLVRTLVTAQQMGVLLKISHEAAKEQFIPRIAALFAMPFEWVDYQLTRTMILEGGNPDEEARLKQAIGKMGVCPDAVLNGTLRASIAPFINRDTHNNKTPQHVNSEKNQSEQKARPKDDPQQIDDAIDKKTDNEKENKNKTKKD